MRSLSKVLSWTTISARLYSIRASIFPVQITHFRQRSPDLAIRDPFTRLKLPPETASRSWVFCLRLVSCIAQSFNYFHSTNLYYEWTTIASLPGAPNKQGLWKLSFSKVQMFAQPHSGHLQEVRNHNHDSRNLLKEPRCMTQGLNCQYTDKNNETTKSSGRRKYIISPYCWVTYD